MAVVRYTGAWTDTTEQAGVTGHARITAIEIMKNPDQSADVFVQVFDGVLGGGVTPGATLPDIVIPVKALANDRGKKVKVIFPGGGIPFLTGFCVFNSTTASGATAPTTTAILDDIKVFYAQGN
jgi:hypothetical protein